MHVHSGTVRILAGRAALLGVDDGAAPGRPALDNHHTRLAADRVRHVQGFYGVLVDSLGVKCATRTPAAKRTQQSVRVLP